MKERKFIIVKKLNKKEEFRSHELDHCKFVGIARASEAKTPEELKTPAPEPLRNEREIEAALSDGWLVLAVCNIPVPVPFVVLNVEAVDDKRKFNASGFITVRLTTGQEFYDWVLGALTETDEVLDTDFWEVLYCHYGLDDYFKHLVNCEKVAQLEKHNIHATDFPDFGEKLRKWFSLNSVDSFRVESSDDEPSAALLKCINAVNKAKNREEARKKTLVGILDEGRKTMIRTWAKKFIDAMTSHPFRTLFTVAVALIAVYFLRGCLSSYSEEKAAQDTIRGIKNATAIAEAANKKPVKGSISVKCVGTGDEAAENLLVLAAQGTARDLVSGVSNGTKAWRDGGKIELPANSWANIVTSVQKFAAESAGEFTCEAKGNDIVIFAHPEVVKSYTLDVDLLRTDAAAIGLVSKAFGVSFGGQTRLGPMPIRAAKRKTALKSLEDTQVKVEVGGDASAIVFAPNLSALSRNDPSAAGMTDAELSKKADAFWRDVAAEKFASLPKAHEDFRLRFSALDHEFTDGFEAAERDLAVLLDDIAQKTQECSVFLAECGAPWRQYSAAMPSDKNAKVRAVREALGGLESLKKSAQARYDRVSFDKDIAAFKKNREQFLFWGGEMIKVYNAQQARLAQMTQLRQNMANALNARSFSQLAAFESSIVERENAQRANRTREIQIGQYVSSICNADYFDQTFGQKWAKAVVRKYSAKVSAVDTLARQAVADFSSDVQRLFGAATLGKALDYGRRLSEAVVDNHKEARDGKTLSEMGAEVASVHGLRNDVAVLKRAQRKLGQR